MNGAGTSVPFWKTQTIGNDFVLLHADDVDRLGLVDSLCELAVEMCERRFGIGSDGLLIVGEESGTVSLRMFNPDGSEDFCGNGLRCAAMHAYRQGWVKEEHKLEHFGRLVHALITEDGYAKTAIGPANYGPGDVPLDESSHPGPMIEEQLHGYVGSAINAGSTHFVTFVDELPDDDEFLSAGPLIENADVFPERTSVIFVKEVAERELKIRIWERGVGETLGCGTGSSAAAAEWMRRNGSAGEVTVRNPGGTLVVSSDSVGGSLVTRSKPTESFCGAYVPRLLQDR